MTPITARPFAHLTHGAQTRLGRHPRLHEFARSMRTVLSHLAEDFAVTREQPPVMQAPPMQGVRVAIYLRTNLPDDYALRFEWDETRTYCARHGHSVFKVYADTGVCITTPLAHRAAGAQLLADAWEGKFDLVVAPTLNRLCLANDFPRIEDELGLLGIHVHTLASEADNVNGREEPVARGH